MPQLPLINPKLSLSNTKHILSQAPKGEAEKREVAVDDDHEAAKEIGGEGEKGYGCVY